jgi:adenylate cyclase
MTHRTAAILFADVAGSSRLYKSLGDARAEELINAVIVEMSALTREAGGAVIKTIGDEIMAGFLTAEAAVRAAMAIHRARRGSSPRLDVHIGIHYGETVVRDGDVYGEAVNDAAHLVRIARAGQVVTTAAVVDELPDELKDRAVRFDRVPLKGSREATVIYLLHWEEETDEPQATGGFRTQLIPALLDLDTPAVATARLEVTYQEQLVSIGPDDPPNIVGRDPDVATLPVRSLVASREHFRIQFRRGKFVLTDNSTNGTWVHLEGQADPIYLRREELPLTDSGSIGIGRPASDDDPHQIRFRL